MKVTTTMTLLAALVLGTAGNAVADIEQTIRDGAQQYQQKVAEARSGAARVTAADMAEFIEAVFADLPVEQFTVDQVAMAIGSMPVTISAPITRRLSTRIAELAQGDDMTAGHAASVQLSLLPRNVTEPARAEALMAVLSHPGFDKAFAAGKGGEIFQHGGQLSPENILALAEPFEKLAPSISAEADVSVFTTGAMFMIQVGRRVPEGGVEKFQVLRAALASAAEEKAAGMSNAQLNRAISQLNGRFAKGELIGHTAPEIEFTWYRDPSDPEVSYSSLSDLRGKVVVIDFWATWCGPCIASFPAVKELQRYYHGFDVVVLGLTSPQGFHVAPEGRINTAGNPQREFELMPQFMEQRDMSWPVAFSKEPVFNPDYGVVGIPSVVIIDPAGKVRYAQLHPNRPLETKRALIDPLLAEAGLQVPATMLLPPPASN